MSDQLTPSVRYGFGPPIESSIHGVRIEELHHLGLAVAMAHRDYDSRKVGTILGVIPPRGPSLAGNGVLTLIGTGPETWLAMTENAAPDWALKLAKRLSGVMSVSDQSGAYAVLRVSGPGARNLLSRGAYIDFHPTTFHVGAAATTVMAHIGVILWQRENESTFEIGVFRSFVASLRQWMEATITTLPHALPVVGSQRAMRSARVREPL